MHYHIEHGREDTGRWLSEVQEIPGALAYGGTPESAMAKAEALALRVLADSLKLGLFCLTSEQNVST